MYKQPRAQSLEYVGTPSKKEAKSPVVGHLFAFSISEAQ